METLLSPGVLTIKAIILCMGTTAGRQFRSVDQAQVTDASLLIVLTADLKAWKKSPERCTVSVPQTNRAAIVRDTIYRSSPRHILPKSRTSPLRSFAHG
jgi:hypothetical protein